MSLALTFTLELINQKSPLKLGGKIPMLIKKKTNQIDGVLKC